MRKSILSVLAASVVFLMGCGGENINMAGKKSTKTGLEYNAGNFAVKNYKGQETAPGLVFIEGGTFHMGGGEKDIAYAMDNRERQVTVSSFYIDETETSNLDWKEFMWYILKDSGQTKFDQLLPDTNCWLRDLAFNDPYRDYYYQHDGFNMYPVVGINWHQANEYCLWRTAKVNEDLLKNDPEAVLWPAYRLPTEAEWEYASRGLLEQENYPWEGKSLRDVEGRFRANLKRGRGDYAGRSNQGGSNLPGGLNDAYMIAAPVKAFMPNDFGLYNMAGNVSEWTLDTYRQLTYEDVDDLNSCRRHGKTTDPYTQDDDYQAKYSLVTHADKNNGSSLFYNAYPNQPNSDNDNVKVYRGGSWADIAYYLTCGSRRFYNADSAACTIGFRCAMIRVGSPF